MSRLATHKAFSLILLVLIGLSFMYLLLQYGHLNLNEPWDHNHLRLSLCVQSPKSLRIGWKRKASFRFDLLNESGKVLYAGTERTIIFCAQIPSWGNPTLPLSKLKEEGFLENNKLIIKVHVKVLEVVHQGKSTENEIFGIGGFEVPFTQVCHVSWLFAKHPDIAVDFRPKVIGVKTAYMNLLIGLMQTLRKSPQSFTEAELNNAQSELNELTEVGFKLDWLKIKLEEVSLERKNALADGSRVQELEERIKNLELTLSDLKVELKIEKAKSAAPAKLLSFCDIL
ncbi:unnamed protein product [Arabis nemorensis]|uniref:MATH domain-containing protein n=1 Tax=Arabis nemorensis TaxID=586526 RepID=A0A565BN82_9BRAS|nr:unnamed protein product [Arabis nemorensis]